MKAVIPAAGLGSRFLPATKNIPKEMLPLVDKPAIHYVVEEAVAAGIRDIIIVTGRGKQAIEDYFDRSPETEILLRRRGHADLADDVAKISDLARIHYVRQKEPLGLGHAVLCARDHIGDNEFAVLLGDDVVFSGTPAIGLLGTPAIGQVMRCGSHAVGVQHVPMDQIEKYGVVGTNYHDFPKLINRVIEKPRRVDAPSDLGIIGRYVLPPDIFRILDRTDTDSNGELQLTDAIGALARARGAWAVLVQGRRYDLGSKLDWLQANVEVALTRPDLGDALRGHLAGLVGKAREATLENAIRKALDSDCIHCEVHVDGPGCPETILKEALERAGN